MKPFGDFKRIVAFDVRARRFGFAVFEGANLLDFGVKSFHRGVNSVVIPHREKIWRIFERFNPEAVIWTERSAGRRRGALEIGAALQEESRKRKIRVKLMTREMVKKAFLGTRNKYEIASSLAQRFPALSSKLSPERKCWQSEDYRMSVFDAAAVGVSYFAQLRVHTEIHLGNQKMT